MGKDYPVNALEQLAAELRSAYPDAKIEVGAPKHELGVWGIDFSRGSNTGEVAWSCGCGFGLSVNSSACYGERPDETYSTVEKVLARIKELVDSGKPTEPPPALVLKALRQSRKLTQAQLAKLLRVKQASVSKLENRADMHISTLRGILGKLGADLEIRAVFPDGVVRIMQFEPARKNAAAKSAAMPRKAKSSRTGRAEAGRDARPAIAAAKRSSA